MSTYQTTEALLPSRHGP